MVEGTPGHPYGSLVQHFNIVEHNMSFRRSEVQSLLQPDEVVLSLTNFFRWIRRLRCGGGWIGVDTFFFIFKILFSLFYYFFFFVPFSGEVSSLWRPEYTFFTLLSVQKSVWGLIGWVFSGMWLYVGVCVCVLCLFVFIRTYLCVRVYGWILARMCEAYVCLHISARSFFFLRLEVLNIICFWSWFGWQDLKTWFG